MQLLRQAFEQAGALDHLEGFAGRHGPIFYDLSLQSRHADPRAPPQPGARRGVQAGEAGDLVPLGAGTTLSWSVLHPSAGHPLQG